MSKGGREGGLSKCVQCNPSKMDTNGMEESVLIKEVTSSHCSPSGRRARDGQRKTN